MKNSYNLKIGLIISEKINNYDDMIKDQIKDLQEFFNKYDDIDLFVTISHNSLYGHTSQKYVPPKILEQGLAKYVFITHQVTKKTINDYYRKKSSYPYIFPEKVSYNIDIFESPNIYINDDKRLTYGIIEFSI